MESLSRCSLEQLGRIASFAGLEVSLDRSGLEAQTVSRLTDPSYLGSLLPQLSNEEWAALKVVFFNGGDQGITVELCHQIVNLMAGRRRKTSSHAVEELQRKGLVYTRNHNYRQVFFIPTDLVAAMTDILNTQMVSRICVARETTVRVLVSERDLVEDLHRFLAYIFNRDVTLTQQGQIFKRHLRALGDLLLTPSDEDESLVGRYPEPLGLLVGFALDRHLIARDNGHLRATGRLDEWLALSSGEKLKDLFDYWQDRYFYQDLQTFLSVMRTVGLQWASVPSVVSELAPMINPSQRGSFLLRLKHHLTTFLGPFGIFDLGETSEHFACRLTPTGQALISGTVPETPVHPGSYHPFVLQANFELVAPRPVSTTVLWRLELMADLVGRTDRTLTYRISRQSIYQALKSGYSGEEMLRFLEAGSSAGVPQNVSFDLRSWAASYGQVYLQEVCLLRCLDPLVAQQVKASRRTGRFVLGEFSPSDLIVSREHYKELLEALEADGLMPRPGVLRMETSANLHRTDR